MRSTFLCAVMLLLTAGASPLTASGLPARVPEASLPAAAKLAEPSDEELINFFDEFATRARDEHQFPGISLVVKRNGHTLLEKGYGVSDYATNRAMSPSDTLVPQGSIAKLLVWVLAMQLVEEGQLDLDRDIQAYLDFPIPATFKQPITMRHLMTHSSGFSQPFYMVHPGFEDADLRTKLVASVPERAYPPGQVTAYSNYGAALAAHVIERLRGESFELLATRRILEQLGMSRSTLQQPVPPDLAPNLASLYGSMARKPQPLFRAGLPPAGSLSATAHDMGRLLDALMVDTPGERLLKADTLELMQRLHQPLVPGLDTGLGLGFIVGHYRGVAYAGHGGSMPAGATQLDILPAHGLGWSISFNGRGRDGAANPIRQVLLRAVISRFYAPSPSANAPAEADLPRARSVAGAYLSTRRGHRGPVRLMDLSTIDVEARSDGALLVTQEGQTATFLAEAADQWRERESGLLLVVERDASSRVVRLASAYLNTVASFERAPVRVSPARWVLMTAPLALLVVAAGGLAARAVRLVRQRPTPATTWSTGATSAATRVVRIAFALSVVTLLGWSALLMHTLMYARAPVDWGPGFFALNALAVASIASAGALVWHAGTRWRDSSATMPHRLIATLVAMATSSLAWVYVAFGFTTFSLRF